MRRAEAVLGIIRERGRRGLDRLPHVPYGHPTRTSTSARSSGMRHWRAGCPEMPARPVRWRAVGKGPSHGGTSLAAYPITSAVPSDKANAMVIATAPGKHEWHAGAAGTRRQLL